MISYNERKVPAEVLAAIEAKKNKTSSKYATAVAEPKKRKGTASSRASTRCWYLLT